MKNSYVVEVMEDDIEKGIRKDPNRCPISRAIKRQIVPVGKGRTTIYVSWEFAFVPDIQLFPLGQAIEYQFPKHTREAIMRFDYFGKMKPFRFRMIRTDKEGR